jgi:hypothetical protein
LPPSPDARSPARCSERVACACRLCVCPCTAGLSSACPPSRARYVSQVCAYYLAPPTPATNRTAPRRATAVRTAAARIATGLVVVFAAALAATLATKLATARCHPQLSASPPSPPSYRHQLCHCDPRRGRDRHQPCPPHRGRARRHHPRRPTLPTSHQNARRRRRPRHWPCHRPCRRHPRRLCPPPAILADALNARPRPSARNLITRSPRGSARRDRALKPTTDLRGVFCAFARTQAPLR